MLYNVNREIVAAAHLKPLDKKDKLKFDDERIVGPWNPSANSQHDSNDIKKESNSSQSVDVSKHHFTFLLHAYVNEHMKYYRVLQSHDENSINVDEVPIYTN